MSTRRVAASRSAATVDASTLLFQREALSTPATLERVSGAHWDPVFADGLALCDEHAMGTSLGAVKCQRQKRKGGLRLPFSAHTRLRTYCLPTADGQWASMRWLYSAA